LQLDGDRHGLIVPYLLPAAEVRIGNVLGRIGIGQRLARILCELDGK
jgi:hypothetical protein